MSQRENKRFQAILRRVKESHRINKSVWASVAATFMFGVSGWIGFDHPVWWAVVTWILMYALCAYMDHRLANLQKR